MQIFRWTVLVCLTTFVFEIPIRFYQTFLFFFFAGSNDFFHAVFFRPRTFHLIALDLFGFFAHECSGPDATLTVHVQHKKKKKTNNFSIAYWHRRSAVFRNKRVAKLVYPCQGDDYLRNPLLFAIVIIIYIIIVVAVSRVAIYTSASSALSLTSRHGNREFFHPRAR